MTTEFAQVSKAKIGGPFKNAINSILRSRFEHEDATNHDIIPNIYMHTLRGGQRICSQNLDHYKL